VAKSTSRKSPQTPRTPRTTLAKRAKSKFESATAVAELDQMPETADQEMEPSDEEIRVRAYFRYLERGSSHGQSLDDWAEARKDLAKKK
jgi:Protein of unknown function (DUF2934)